MRYLLLISADEQAGAAAPASEPAGPGPETAGEVLTFAQWLADVQRRGVLEMHAGLHPSDTATTVRRRSQEVLLTDGPFLEGREQVGGLALLNCRDLDEAIEIAAAHPAAAFGQVEIRPVRP
jgi:hypothetical protein